MAFLLTTRTCWVGIFLALTWLLILPSLANAQQAPVRLLQGPTDNTPGCKTSTFFMRLPAMAGHKIDLRAVQTLPGGDFIAIGNTMAPNGEQQGLLLQLSNAGNIMAQNLLRINNQPATVFSAKVLLSGNIAIGGVLRDGSRNVFTALVKADGSVVWVNTFAATAEPLKVTVDVYNDSLLALAVQHSASVVYAALKADGSVLWKKEVVLDGLTELVGFSSMNWSPLGLVANCMQNGKEVVRVLEVSKADGSIISAHILDHENTAAKALAATFFSSRLRVSGIVKRSDTEVELVRDILYSSALSETKHCYKLPFTMDFTISGAMDNAADVMAFCLPQQGKMVFIRQFANYATTPEYTREYAVPPGASMAGITRSFDGGFLFGLNTGNASEVLLIKTDSVGVLAGCGYADVANTFREQMNTPHTVLPAGNREVSWTPAPAALSRTGSSLTAQFDCRQNYCPSPPVADTCLSTYFKTFRSNSYSNSFSTYHLMRNNRQLTGGSRFDRILGSSHQVTSGLKLFDEKGTFLKGVSMWADGVPGVFSTLKVTDSTIILLSYMVKNGAPCLTFTLVSDDLQILWSKSVTSAVFPGLGNGFAAVDVHRDEEGNYYFAGSSMGYMQKARILVYKMDGNGNEVWLKVYELAKGLLGGPVRVVSTKASVIAIIEGSADGSATVRLEKQTGNMQNSYLYQNNWAGALYSRLAGFYEDRILYAGNNGNSQFVMGLFDTTGRPMQLKYIQNSAGLRVGTIRSGMLYATYKYFDATVQKDVLLKADTGLNLVFVHEYTPTLYGFPSGMGVSDDGSVYVGGNYSARWTNSYYYDPYIIKYSPAGELGSCSYVATTPTAINIDPKAEALGFSPLQQTFTPVDVSIGFIPDTEGQVVSDILCSSAPTCTEVMLSGPEAVCQLDEDITYTIRKNAGCTLSPQLLCDTAFVKLQQLTDTTVTVRFKKQGNPWLKVWLNAGCRVYEDSLQVNTAAAAPRLYLGADTVLCNGNALVLAPQGTYAAYQWQDGSTGAAYTVTSPGTYHVEVTDGCGDVASDTVRVGSLVIPFDVGADRVKCNSDTVQLRAPSGFAGYAWSNNYQLSSATGQQVVVNPLIDTAYYVRAEKSPGCFVYDTVRVAVFQSPAIHLGSDTSFCAGGSVLLNAGSGFAQYQWSTGAGTPQLLVQAQGQYAIRATTAEGCSSYDTLRVLNVFTNPVVRLDKNDLLCTGSSRVLDAGAFASYLWQDGSTGRRLMADNVGMYFVQVVDGNGCTGSDTTRIRTILPLPKGFLPPDTTICSYSKLELRPQGAFTSYSWNTGASTPTLSIERPAVYWLEVKDRNNCMGRDSVMVSGKECMKGLYVPSAFTPNKDGRNDKFRPLLFGNVVSLQFTVYNRWGEVVFTTTDRTRGWDGTYKGLPQDANVFVWLCRYRLEGEEEKLEKGTVMLIR